MLTPDPQDNRDYLYTYDQTDILPSSVSLRRYCGQVENQLGTAACTANATVSAAEMFLIANGFVDTPDTDKQDLSRMFNFYNSRVAINALTKGGGSSLREALRSLKNHGCCSEQTWPYDEAKSEEKPSDLAYVEALTQRAGGYYRINDNTRYAMCHALASGYPVIFTLVLNENFYDLKPGQVLPQTDMSKIAGVHVVLAIGYDDNAKTFTFKNSWSDQYCEGGYFHGVQDLVTTAGDIWVLKGFAGYDRIAENLIVKPVVIEPVVKPIKPISFWQKIINFFRGLFK